MMLTVQMMSGSVEAGRANGSSHSRYQGYTTGAHKSDAAMGHANVSENNVGILLLIQIAVATPTTTAKPATTCGGASRSSVANIGALKRKLWTYVPRDPNGIPARVTKGKYRSATTRAASAASRMRTRFQYSGSKTMGRNLTAMAS